MKNVVAVGCVVTALLAWGPIPALAGLLFHKKACCCPPPPVTLHAEVLQRHYTVETKVANPPVVKTRVVSKDVPCTRMVEMAVTDPLTGCTHIEQRPQTVTEKVTFTVIDVCPPEKPFTVKKEEKVEQCLRVHIVPLPLAPCPEETPLPRKEGP